MAHLIAVAEAAVDIGSGLKFFLDPVADHSADISDLIGQCFRTSSALQRLDTAIEETHHRTRYPYLIEDLNTVRNSLHYTIRKVQRIIGGLGGGVISPAAYRRVWRELSQFFVNESGNTLCRRFEIYQLFSDELRYTLIQGSPPDPDGFEETRDKIVRLLGVQDDQSPDDPYRTSLSVTNIPKSPSFERNRPRGGQTPAQPHSPPPVPHRAGRTRPAGPKSPRMEHDFDRRRDRFPPFAPEVPDSPTTTNTNTSSSTHFSNTPSLSSHWLPVVFGQSQPTTSLGPTGQSSVSLGVGHGPEASKRLADEYVKLLEMPFENGDLLVRLHQRSEDFRSRILIRTIRPTRMRKDCCLPLTHLEVERSGPFLKFSKISNRSPELWACLKFPSYEKMVLFFCSFLALRSEDTKTEITAIADSQLHNEKELFGGRIVDDYYQHALRLYRDKDSGGIRLQASVLRGDLQKTPIWTAFITHQVQSRRWLRQVSSKVVHLADLQRYIFTTDYTPQVAPGGKHELCFDRSSDATEFVDAIADLVDDY